MQGHKDLIAWQKAMDLVVDVYRATKLLPKEETYGLVSQMRRAAVSVPSNLAEGHGRSSKKEFHLFIGNARGSLLEPETQIELSQRLGYLSSSEAKSLLGKTAEVGRILTGLRTWSRGASAGSER
ncbi:MAG: four helix bundle protein [Candidatus Koribacter versatilis]|uniref:Four helix bundle protein n=1 Tax=Candidatus Korobacter versatilis TaxID=658062 RepID=A0A932AB02_9BACT|nr:four helix bundle protein [Candidatus Koribacter versatilis]